MSLPLCASGMRDASERKKPFTFTHVTSHKGPSLSLVSLTQERSGYLALAYTSLRYILYCITEGWLDFGLESSFPTRTSFSPSPFYCLNHMYMPESTLTPHPHPPPHPHRTHGLFFNTIVLIHIRIGLHFQTIKTLL